MKKLGFGLMRLPLLDKNDDTSIDFELTNKIENIFFPLNYTVIFI